MSQPVTRLPAGSPGDPRFTRPPGQPEDFYTKEYSLQTLQSLLEIIHFTAKKIDTGDKTVFTPACAAGPSPSGGYANHLINDFILTALQRNIRTLILFSVAMEKRLHSPVAKPGKWKIVPLPSHSAGLVVPDLVICVTKVTGLAPDWRPPSRRAVATRTPPP